MKLNHPFNAKQLLTVTLLALACLRAAAQDPRTNSWLTTYSGKYARIYTNDVAKTNGVTGSTWGNGTQNQTTPTYVGIQEVYSSASWVYIRSSGLGSHTMGPWYNDATRTTLFVNMPANQKVLYRIPRVPSVPGAKSTANGEVGYMVDGVKIFDARDAVSYINSTGQDGNPPGVGTQGDGIWNRDAYVNEAITFDPSLAHQQNTGVYHYHASPLALRYLLGDNVNFNSTNKLYTPNTNAPTKHSPIIGWANDGFPVYGPYGYSSASNSASGLRRMVSGFVPRDGANGTTNLPVTGRTSLPAWAQRVQGRTTLTAAQYGPSNFTTFPLGRYTEDNDYLGDLGQVQGVGFDLDEYNGRWCVTPEFPGGTYAYFNCISANGNPAYPYNLGRQYYGTSTAGTVTSITETVVTNFLGGPNLRETMNPPAKAGNTVTLTWSAVEGGTYRVESSTNLAAWTTNVTGVTAVLNTGSNALTSTNAFRFFRVYRTALATYDSVGGTTTGGGNEGISSIVPSSGARNTSVPTTITLNSGYTMAPPPNNIAPTAVTLTLGATTINATSFSRNATTGIVSATFPLGAVTGAYTVNCTFGPNTWSLTGGFTVN